MAAGWADRDTGPAARDQVLAWAAEPVAAGLEGVEALAVAEPEGVVVQVPQEAVARAVPACGNRVVCLAAGVAAQALVLVAGVSVGEVVQAAEAEQVEVAAGLVVAEGQGPAGALRLQVGKSKRQENGYRLRHCCAAAHPREFLACQEWEQEREREAAAHTAWRKKTFVRCWDCSRNWANREKILKTEWMFRRFNRG